MKSPTKLTLQTRSDGGKPVKITFNGYFDTDETDSAAVALAQEMATAESRYIEMMAAAYLKHTSLPPDQVMMVRQFKDGIFRVWFQRRPDDLPQVPA